MSYNEKHNDSNGENNADGDNYNNSWNCGEEGPTTNSEILALREKQKRNLVATLMLSQGVPMICGGDEISRTQQGNNNAYCQDNETSWYHWTLSAEQKNFLEFCRYMVRLREIHPVLRRRRFFQGRPIRGYGIKDLAWFSPNGREMNERAWNAHFVRCLGFHLVGTAMEEMDEDGNPVMGDTLFVMLNAHHETLGFLMPKHAGGEVWERILDTSLTDWNRPLRLRGNSYPLQGRSVAVFRVVPK